MTEEMHSILILVGTCWGCALVFLLIGFWADHRKDPMHFYAGVPVDPQKISDVQAYNRANGVMWKLYSVPYWIAGVVSFFHEIAATIIIVLACFPGIILLFWRYSRICKEYMIR